MKYKNTTMIVFGTLAIGLSTVGSAAVTDTLDFSNPGPGTTYWVPDDASKYDNPYWRGYDEDWGWTHAAIGGLITSASLNISAFDVDAPSENDQIEAWNATDSTWDLLGSLAGSNDAWEFTNFNLASSWFDEIAAGLQVRMLIDVATQGDWLVTLAKSSLSVNGGVIPDPTPNAVPLPAAAFMFAPALLGFMGLRRKAKKAVV